MQETCFRVAPNAPSTFEVFLFFHNLTFLITIKTGEMTQVFASRVGNVVGSS